ncbi:MAG: ATP-dependent helicase, partial [Chloroflexia bacterium]|nr:ATP-dependent helicase [Chloroflexia bacterium]
MKSEHDLPFTDEQRRAIHHDGSSLRIIAGAGTGKTATLTARFAHLVERDDLQIGDVLALTFTNKAASEMKSRIIDQLDRSYSEFWVNTFHAFCQRILRTERGRQGLPAPRILEGQARRNLLKRTIEHQQFPAYGTRRTELVRQALVLVDRAKDELLTPAALLDNANAQNDPQLQDLAVAYTLYQEALVFGDRDFDWGELQTRVIDTLENDPATLQRWRGRFKHILVDEYQDINRAQFRLIELLAGNGRNLTVVGDVDQSVYAFRGASHTFLSEMSRSYPDVETVHLTRNFRSHQKILDVANALIDVNPHDRQQLVAHDGRTGNPPTVTQASDEHREAESIARQIARLHWIDDVPLDRIAVLLRSVQMGAGPIEGALEAVGLRSSSASGADSTDEASRDVLAVFRLIDEIKPGDLIRILISQGADPVEIAAAQVRATREEQSLVDVLTALDPLLAPAARAALDEVAALKDRPLPEQTYEATVLCGRLPLGETVTRDDYRYMRSLRRIIERAQDVAERGGTRAAFIQALESANSPLPEAGDTTSVVQIMTV